MLVQIPRLPGYGLETRRERLLPQAKAAAAAAALQKRFCSAPEDWTVVYASRAAGLGSFGQECPDVAPGAEGHAMVCPYGLAHRAPSVRAPHGVPKHRSC